MLSLHYMRVTEKKGKVYFIFCKSRCSSFLSLALVLQYQSLKKKHERDELSFLRECPAYHHFTGTVSQIRSHTVFDFRAYKHKFI